MSKLYNKLQIGLTSYEKRPVLALTRQKLGDRLFIVRGTDRGCTAWHCILVPDKKANDLNKSPKGSRIDTTKFGQVIQYFDRQGEIKSTSGWGKNPPQMLVKWLHKQYDLGYFDETDGSSTYEKDDIRLCIMQRAIATQKVGVFSGYHREEHSINILLTKELEASLAYRAGIKDYDVVIAFNGVSVEYDTYDQYLSRWDTTTHLPTELLVCDRATYQHYQELNQTIHRDLPTVQHLKPVYATVTSDSNTSEQVIRFDEHIFCTVHLREQNIVTIVSQSAVYKSPEFTQVNDRCFVELDGKYEKVQILFIGSRNDCETSKSKALLEIADTSDLLNPKCLSRRDLTTPTRFEELPNELLHYLYTLLDVENLYNGFWGLNLRLNGLFQSSLNLSFTLNEFINEEAMHFYAPFVTRLVLDRSKRCALHLYSTLKILVIGNNCPMNIDQIQAKILPNLTHLSFLLGAGFITPLVLVEKIFSGAFPFLHYVNLSQIDQSKISLHSMTAPSLRFVSIRLKTARTMNAILHACPNLDHLQLHIFEKELISSAREVTPISSSLRRLTLWSDTLELDLNSIQTYLSCVPDLQQLYLQTEYKASLVDLANSLLQQLKCLSRFDCRIEERISNENRLDVLATINRLHPCFTRIKCVKERPTYRVFTTD